MAEGTRGYAHRIDIRAPRELVWRALTEPALLAEWYAPGARIAARAGGRYWVRLNAKLEREAHIDVFEPPRRLRLVYLPSLGMPDREAVLVDDFLLGTEDDCTVLRLLGSGVPDTPLWEPFSRLLRPLWERSLARLKVSVERLNGAAVRPERPATSGR